MKRENDALKADLEDALKNNEKTQKINTSSKTGFIMLISRKKIKSGFQKNTWGVDII